MIYCDVFLSYTFKTNAGNFDIFVIIYYDAHNHFISEIVDGACLGGVGRKVGGTLARHNGCCVPACSAKIVCSLLVTVYFKLFIK